MDQPGRRRYRCRHAAPGRWRRAARAARRGAARVIAVPLWPGYITYKYLEPRRR